MVVRSLEDVRDAISSRPVGYAQPGEWALPSEALILQSQGQSLDLRAWNRVVDVSPADLVATVQTGITVRELNRQLASHNLCLPYAPYSEAELDMDLATLIGTNFPHRLEAKTGSWRDWILGATVCTGTGLIGRFGSRVVKSVAGYDGHKIFVGARGTLAFVAEVHLRLRVPLETPPPLADYNLLHRVWASDWASACATYGATAVYADESTNTIVAQVPADFRVPAFEGAWVMRSGVGKLNLSSPDQGQIHYYNRAQAVWDPEHRLNPGALGL